jgi:hypothetical protein
MKEILPFFVKNIAPLMKDWGYVRKGNKFTKFGEGFRIVANCGKERDCFVRIENSVVRVPDYIVVHIQFDLTNYALHDHLNLGWRSNGDSVGSNFFGFGFDSKSNNNWIFRNTEDVSRHLPDMLQAMRSDDLPMANRMLTEEGVVNRVIEYFDSGLLGRLRTSVHMELIGVYLMCKRGNFDIAQKYLNIMRQKLKEHELGKQIQDFQAPLFAGMISAVKRDFGVDL